MKNFFLQFKNKSEKGYLLIFALIVTGITLAITISVVNIMAKELYFSRLINNSKKAYFAAATGRACAQYLDSTFKNFSSNSSIILNSTSTDNGQDDFEKNEDEDVFSKSLGNNIFARTLITGNNHTEYNNKIFCASDASYNQMFKNYAENNISVKNNLESDDHTSSYNVSGTNSNATTTFGLILKKNDDEVDFCIYVEFGKVKSPVPGHRVISTGYSSCDKNDKSRVSRTIVWDF